MTPNEIILRLLYTINEMVKSKRNRTHFYINLYNQIRYKKLKYRLMLIFMTVLGLLSINVTSVLADEGQEVVRKNGLAEVFRYSRGRKWSQYASQTQVIKYATYGVAISAGVLLSVAVGLHVSSVYIAPVLKYSKTIETLKMQNFKLAMDKVGLTKKLKLSLLNQESCLETLVRNGEDVKGCLEKLKALFELNTNYNDIITKMYEHVIPEIESRLQNKTIELGICQTELARFM